jgi:hypothetical protein
MKKTAANSLVLLEEVRQEMVFPHTGTPIDPRALQRYLVQLAIKAELLKVKGNGPLRQHVTPAQAEAIRALFKAKHWRKFKAVELKPKRKGD